jgi:alpha-glucosidase
MKITHSFPWHSITTEKSGFSCSGRNGSLFRTAFLEEWLVRVSYLPEGAWRLDRTWMIQGTKPQREDPVPREGRERSDESVFTCPPITVSAKRPSSSEVSIKGTTLTVRFQPENGGLVWENNLGICFARDLPHRSYARDISGTRVWHYMERRPDELYYGFGERCGPLNKKGMRMEMRNLDALGYNAFSTDPLYKHWPIYITFLPDQKICYALLYDNLSDTVFDMGKEIDAYHGDYRCYQAAGGDIDYYLLYGPDIKSVVQRIAQLTGTIQLPPKWALGYLGSGMGYTDSPHAAVRLGDFVKECREHRIPCDMFHLSSGYSMSNNGERWVFVWNRDRVPHPPDVAETFHTAGMKVCANIKPCLLETHPEYKEAAGRGIFLESEEGPHLNTFWGGKGSYIDFTSDTGYRWWQEQVRDHIIANGIDSTWNDNNEYEVWDDEILCKGFGNPVPVYLIRPVQTLLMTRASWETQCQQNPQLRPFLLTRSGCPGIQRYAQSWSGDNSTNWESLKYNIPMGLGLSITGQPNIGHDVGGFLGKAPSPELFIRWVQNGIFHPRFSIHSWRTDGTASEPWMYPEVIDIVRDAIEFRYKLVPYLYSLFMESAYTGAPIIRPMVYEFPDDPACMEESFDFLLGKGLLVASIFQEGNRSRKVYLPEGPKWCDYYTGVWYNGGCDVEVPAPLERPAILVREGSIIPQGKLMPYIGALPDDYRALYVFPAPGKSTGTFRLYEDDGLTNSYVEGEQTVVTAKIESDVETINIDISFPEQGYPLPYREITVLLPPGENRKVTPSDFSDRGVDSSQRRILTIPLPKELSHA